MKKWLFDWWRGGVVDTEDFILFGNDDTVLWGDDSEIIWGDETWILSTGVWQDAYVWIDNETWNDS